MDPSQFQWYHRSVGGSPKETRKPNPPTPTLSHFIQRGMDYASSGISFEESKQWDRAFDAYLCAMEYYLAGIQEEENPAVRDKIRGHLAHLLERGEAAQAMLRKEEEKRRNAFMPLHNPRHIPASNDSSEEESMGMSHFLEQSTSASPSSSPSSASMSPSPSGGSSFAFRGELARERHVKGMVEGLRRVLSLPPTPVEGNSSGSSAKVVAFHFSQVITETCPISDASGGGGGAFVFRSYAPFVFEDLRARAGVDHKDYAYAVAGQDALFRLKSPGKSPSFFYYSMDHRYIIKTISKAEFEQMQNMLAAYYYYVMQFPHTLMSRFYGLHSIGEDNGTAPMYFVIMENVFPIDLEIHRCYDLKGSTRGRLAKVDPKKEGSTVLKDLDLPQGYFKLAPNDKNNMFAQLHQDSLFLESNYVMDYSLLAGVHHKEQHRTYTVEEKTPFFKRCNGGLESADGKSIYFFGVIDFFTLYGWKKVLENSLKSIYNEEMTISAVNPHLYRERFIHFLYSNCFE